MMRILLASDLYPPIAGGKERYVQALADGLTRRGHQVSVVTLQQGDAPALTMDDGVRIHRLAGAQRVLSPFYAHARRRFHLTMPDPAIMAGLRGVIARERPQIINAHGWIVYSLLPLKTWSRARLVMTMHDYGLDCVKTTYLHRGKGCAGARYAKCVRCGREQYGLPRSLALTTGLHLSRGLHRTIDRFIAVSGPVRDAALRAIGTPAPPIDVVPAFIADSVLSEAATVPRPDFLPPHDNYLLYVGELAAHKGVQPLLDAYAGLEHMAPLVLIGTPYGRATFRWPAGAVVVRDVPHAAVMAAWTRSLLGVVPSIWPDPCPLVAIEAMVAGRPIVASATGGLTELVLQHETGILVAPGDVAALRDALHALLSDPDRRDRLGAAARARAPLYTASAIIHRIEQIFEELLVTPARRSAGGDCR